MSKYPIQETLDNYNYRWKRNKVMRDPDKMTFDPDFAAIQYEHKIMIANTGIIQYLKYNTDARFALFLASYLVVVAFSLLLLYFMQ